MIKPLLTQVIALSLLAVATASAQLQDVQLTVTRQKLDEQKSKGNGPTTITTKEVSYRVTVQNRTFKAMPELTVKYMIFFEMPEPGTKESTTKSNTGSEKIMSLEANRSTTFDTKPFKLETEQLDPGWVYANGSANKSKDRVAGIWVRAYNTEGKIIGEYVNPTTLSKKNDWKE